MEKSLSAFGELIINFVSASWRTELTKHSLLRHSGLVQNLIIDSGSEINYSNNAFALKDFSHFSTTKLQWADPKNHKQKSRGVPGSAYKSDQRMARQIQLGEV